MKKTKILGLSMVLFVLMSSYGNLKTNKQNNESFSTILDNTVSETDEYDCDTFLENYDKFVDKYIIVLKKYKENPTDMTIITEYSELAAETAKWSGWTPPECSEPEHVKKLAEIAAKLAKAAATMY